MIYLGASTATIVTPKSSFPRLFTIKFEYLLLRGLSQRRNMYFPSLIISQRLLALAIMLALLLVFVCYDACYYTGINLFEIKSGLNYPGLSLVSFKSRAIDIECF